MIKYLDIDGVRVTLNYSLNWLRIYERAFHEDALLPLFESLKTLVPLMAGGEPDYTQIDIVYLIRLLWAMAYNHSESVGDPSIWASQWETLDLTDIIDDLTELLYHSSIAKPTKKGGQGDGDITLDMVIMAGISRGLNLTDTKETTLAEWLNMISSHEQPSEQTVREASQTDFDNFKRR